MDRTEQRTHGARSVRLMLTVFLLMLTLIPSFTLPAYASDTYYLIQMTVNQETWLVEGAVVADEVGAVTSQLEAKRFSTDELKSLAQNSETIQGGKISTLGTSKSTPWTTGLTSKENLVLTFPGKTISSGSRAVGGSGTDQGRAETIKNGLVFDLNEAITICFPDRRSWTITDFETHMDELLSAVKSHSTLGGVTFSAISLDEYNSIGRIDNTVLSSDYVKLTVGGRKHILLWRMPKGYVESAFAGTRVRPLGLTGTASSSEDAAFVNWEMLLYEAVGNSLISGDLGVSSGTVTQGTTSQLSSAISNVVGSICDHIRGILGLWSLDQLIYNAGNRGTNSYIYGLFPATWENTIWGFFVVSEILSIVFLFYSLIMNVLRRAAATTNFMSRLRMWEQTKDILVVAVGLAILPLLVQVVMSLSFNLTGIIIGAANGKSLSEMRDSFSATASFGAAIVQFMYLGIDIYYNFFYLLRSLMVALLIILGPVCLVVMTFDNKYKMMASGWARELLANVVIQPIHALVFTIILLFPASSHRFDVIIMAYATIPLTTAVRSLLLGSAGGMSDMLSGKGKDRVTGAMKGVVGGAIGAAAGGIAAGIAGKQRASGEAPAQDQSTEGRTQETAPSQSAASITAQNGTAGSFDTTAPVVTGGPGAGESSQTSTSSAETQAVASAETPANTGNTRKLSEYYRNIPDGAKDILKGTAGTVWGAAKTVAGVSLGGVMGGISGATGMRFGRALDVGAQQLTASGLHSMGSGIKTFASGAHLTAKPGNSQDAAGTSDTAPEQGAAGGATLPEATYQDAVDTTDALNSVFSGENTATDSENADILRKYGSHEEYGARDIYRMDEQAQAAAGISSVYANKDTLSFKAAGASAQMYGAYNNTLNSLPAEKRQQLEAATGVSVKPVTRDDVATGEYTVTIDKERYRQATGTSIYTSKGEKGFTVESRNSTLNPAALAPQTKVTRTTTNSATGQKAVEQGSVSYSQAARLLNTGVIENPRYTQRVELANGQRVGTRRGVSNDLPDYGYVRSAESGFYAPRGADRSGAVSYGDSEVTVPEVMPVSASAAETEAASEAMTGTLDESQTVVDNPIHEETQDASAMEAAAAAEYAELVAEAYLEPPAAEEPAASYDEGSVAGKAY